MEKNSRAFNLREDGRSCLQHGPISVVAFRQCTDDQMIVSPSVSCIVERYFDAELSLKVFCEVEGPKPQASSISPSPLNIQVVARENDTPRWWQKQTVERNIHSALLPALVTPGAGWAGTSFDVSFVVELPFASTNNSEDEKNLDDELCFLQLIAACVNAGSVALMARGIPMRDLVIGCVCSLGLISSDEFCNELPVVVDPTSKEASDMAVVVGATIMPSLGQFTALWWHTSHKHNFRTAASMSFVQNQAKILKTLIASAISLRPMLTDALKPE